LVVEMISRSTRELFWSRALGSYRDEDAVAWAAAEVERQPPSPNLAALATSVFPYNHFEVEDLLRRALAEIGVSEPDRAVSWREFMYETGRAILEGTLTPREGCANLLHLGIHDLEAEAMQWYYDGLTVQNFDELVRREAEVLVEATRGTP
jgi:hypothetical protein